jgi:AAA ATPase domain
MSPSEEQQRDPVIGHRSERAALDDFVGRIAAGAAAMVLEGPAGIGKTALWSYGARVAAPAARVLTTRPGEFETKLSYSGLEDLLNGMAVEISRLAVPQRRALQRALRMVDAGSVVTDDSAVAIAATNTLRTAAADGPLVIAIDDLQWLDASSARVLGFALRRLGGESVGVLTTARAGEAPSVLARALGHDKVTLLEVRPSPRRRPMS